MQIKVNKKSASIIFESVDEIKDFATAVEFYMDMVHEESSVEDRNGADEIMEKIDKKFNK